MGWKKLNREIKYLIIGGILGLIIPFLATGLLKLLDYIKNILPKYGLIYTIIDDFAELLIYPFALLLYLLPISILIGAIIGFVIGKNKKRKNKK